MKNIFSIKPDNIDYIYIDNFDEQSNVEIGKKLKMSGFSEVRKSSFQIFSNLIKTIFSGKIYNLAIFFIVLLEYLLLIFLMFVYVKDIDRYILIHSINGANFFSFLFYYIKKTILNLIIILLLSTTISVVYLNIISQYRLNIIYNIFINAAVFFIVISFVLIKIIFSYEKEFYLRGYYD